MIKKGIIVTVIFIVSTLIQLISQIVVTRIFGAKIDLDIFLAAVTIPTILVTVIYGTLNDAFLPLYGEQKKRRPKTSDEYFLSMLLITTFLSFVIAWLMGFFSNSICRSLYGSRGIGFVDAVATQMSFMFYSMPASVIATMLGTYFYLHRRFARFPFAQMFGSIANLLMIILLAPHIGIWSLVVSFVINILIQILFVIPKIDFIHPVKLINIFNRVNFKNFTSLFFAWIPLIIANFALRSDSLIIRSFGVALPVGYLVYLNLISKIFSLATGMMTIGIQVLQLPHLVEYFNRKDYVKAITTVNRAKISSIGISLLTVLAIVVLAPVFINFLFVGGKFTKHDADTTISLLPYFVLPGVGWGISSVFMQPLIALKKQLTVGVLNISAFILSWLTTALILPSFGALPAISYGLIILLGIGIIGSEILWQIEKKKLNTKSQ